MLIAVQGTIRNSNSTKYSETSPVIINYLGAAEKPMSLSPLSLSEVRTIIYYQANPSLSIDLKKFKDVKSYLSDSFGD